MNNYKIAFVIIAWIISATCLTGCYSTSAVATVQYANPVWAPPYYSGTRYYYLPDIEVYYDLSNQQFVYLDNGQWLFTAVLPPVYAGYNLYDCFVVALNFRVYQPWMHHHYYREHYPRFYYHHFYNGQDISRIRGFNENNRRPFYFKPGTQRSNNRWQPTHPANQTPVTRPPRNPGYNNRNVGQPVRVTRPMRQNNTAAKRPPVH